MAANPLTLSPAFSSSNLSELSDYELIEDREAWSSNDADSQSDVGERSSTLSHSNSFVLDHHSDHGTDAWDSLHLVDPTQSVEALNERNEQIADELGRESSSVESFVSDRGASNSDTEQREDSADRTLTDIELPHSDDDSLKGPAFDSENGTLSKATGSAAESRVGPAPPVNGTSNIRLLFPDPIEGSAISYREEESQAIVDPSHAESEEDTDAQSSALFESVSSLASLSRDGSSFSFNVPFESEIVIPAIHVNMADEDDTINPFVEIDEDDTSEEDPEELEIAAEPQAIPWAPPRDPSEEVVREPLEREKKVKCSAPQTTRKESNRSLYRFDRYTTKRNLIVSVISVMICSACCVLYGWKATVARFDLSLYGFNRSTFAAPSIFSNLRSSTLTNQDASKPSPTSAPTVSTSMVLTLDPIPPLRTIDGPKAPAHFSASTSGISTMSRTDPGRTTTDLAAFIPKALTKYIPPSTLNPFFASSSSSSSNSQTHPRTTAAANALPFIAPLKDRLCEAQSMLSERHQRAKANARKLGEMGKKVWSERCGNCVGEALGKLRVGLQGVAGVGGEG